MKSLLTQLFDDETGFIISAELILVATILVISMIVGLAAVSTAVNNQLQDVASGFDSINHRDRYSNNSDDSGYGDDKGGGKIHAH